VQQGDSFGYLQRYHGEPFNLIYVAPPQYQGLWRKALLLIDQRPELLAPYGTVIIQIHPKEDGPLVLTHLEEYDRRKYGWVMLAFYARATDLASESWDEQRSSEEETAFFEDDEEVDEAE